MNKLKKTTTYRRVFSQCMLFCRILIPLGINFFIAPAPEIDVEWISVHIKVNPQDFDNNTVPALLVWDSFVFNFETKGMFYTTAILIVIVIVNLIL